MFDINKLYTYQFTVLPEDNHKWGNKKIEVSGLVVADHIREAIDKVYSYCGVEIGKTVSTPNIRHLVTEQLPYLSGGTLTTGFAVIEE